ncbi:TIGR02556 family CRISPR-associated protein [bacterium]|nr:TIGR02556 family CRISPR-associated protein [bacterium]
MINAMANIGKYYLRKNPETTFLDMVVDDAWDGGKYEHLLVIVFEFQEEELHFSDVEYKQLDSNFKRKILYKRGSPRGTDFTPTTKKTDDFEKKTFPNKILNWFKNNKDKPTKETNRKFLNEIYKEISNEKVQIITKVKEKLQEITDQKGVAVTVGFTQRTESIKYIGDYEFFKEFLKTEAKKEYKESYGKLSFSTNKVCSICNQNKGEVFGFFSELKFYSADKIGMVTGGFKQEDAWKNYPVCFDCAIDIRNGFNFLKENFTFIFYGIKYLLIPKIYNNNHCDIIIDNILEYNKNPKFKLEDIEKLTNDENELFNYLKDIKSNMTLDLFFFETPQKSVLRILQLITEIPPSRLIQMYNSKDIIDNLIFFKDAISKKGERLCYFNFGIVRNFYPRSKKEGNKDKYFLEITDKIFKNKRINISFLLNSIMKKIRYNFSNDLPIWLDTLKGFMLIIYLNKLENIKYNKEESMDKQFYDGFIIQTKEEFNDKVSQFFNFFKGFFQTDVHKGIFLMGVLTQFLLNIQQNERGATPFRTKLKSLKMSGYDISMLLPEIIEKLEQYDKNYYPTIEELVSKYLLSAGNYTTWKVPLDEMNFIFVLGMNLAKYFKIKKEEKEEDTNE